MASKMKVGTAFEKALKEGGIDGGLDRLHELRREIPAIARWLDRPWASEALISTAVARRWLQALELSAESVAEEQSCTEEAISLATRLAVVGDYPLRCLRRHRDLLAWLVETAQEGDPWSVEALESDLDIEGLTSASRQEARAKIRRFRHRQHLRIYGRELKQAPLRELTAEIADVAMTCVRGALHWVTEYREGIDGRARLCVLALGKLGGRELNYSSDVDLVVVAEDGVTQGELKRLEDLFREVIGELEAHTDDGRALRVDMRLRPDGSRGRLINTAQGTLDYYLNHGRTWERSAWLKARAIAGHLPLGQAVLEGLEPFIYRRYLDYDAIDEIRRMKELIDRQSRASEVLGKPPSPKTSNPSSESPLKQRLRARLGAPPMRSTRGVRPATSSSIAKSKTSDGGWDVKRGTGGIREVEFFVQALQLIHCGKRPELRVSTTLEALDRLLYSGLLDRKDHRQLADSYDLFRRLEHRLQLAEDRQTHRVPAWDDDEGWQELRLSLGPGLRERLREARGEVRAIFERLFEASPRKPSKPTVPQAPSTLATLVVLPREELLSDNALELLRQAGFERPRQVGGQLQILRQKGQGPFSADPSTADPEFAEYLLEAVRQAPDPEGALSHLVSFSTAIGDTPSTWGLLSEERHAARLLIHLFGSSPPMARLLAQEPELFERLVYRDSVELERSAEALVADLERRLQGVDDRARRLGLLRRLEREEGVRIALHEVAGQVDIEATCRQWSNVAELGVATRFREVVEEFSRTHGLELASGDPVDELPLAVVAMGKLGSQELGIGGDLDLLFVYDDDSSLLGQEVATRLARRIVRALGMPGGLGEGYEIDLRLRPSGAGGRLVVGASGWDDYYDERASLWERQALLKARPLTGTEDLRQEVEAIRHRHCFERPLPDDAKEQVQQMRGSLYQSALDEKGPKPFDIKAHRGGLLDIEFMVQWAQLSRRSVALDGRSTFSLLRYLVQEQPWAGLDGDYRWLRRLELRLGIAGQGRQLPVPRRQRESLARQMGLQGEDVVEQFERQLQRIRQRVQQAWRTLIGPAERAR